MHVHDLMTQEVIVVHPDTSIQEIARRMVAHAISSLPVVDSAGHLMGIVTEADLVARHAPPDAPAYYPLLWGLIPLRLSDYTRWKDHVRHILAVNAAQLMTAQPRTIHPDASIEEAAKLMMRPGHNALPVVDAQNRLVGILTRADLVRFIAQLEAGDPEEAADREP